MCAACASIENGERPGRLGAAGGLRLFEPCVRLRHILRDTAAGVVGVAEIVERVGLVLGGSLFIPGDGAGGSAGVPTPLVMK